MTMVTHWKGLLREVMVAPSVEALKARFDGALSNLLLWKVSLPMAFWSFRHEALHNNMILHNFASDIIISLDTKPAWKQFNPICTGEKSLWRIR